MLKIYKNSIQSKPLRRIKGFSSNVWISLISPNEDDILKIRKHLHISAETMQDCLDEYELPRIKIENNNLIIMIRAVVKKESYKTTPLTIILNEHSITTISLCDLNLFNNLKNRRGIYTTQRSNFLINIFLEVINQYQNYINQINKKVSAKKRKIKSIDKKDVFLLVEIEEILNHFISSLVPNINVIKRILANNYIILYQRDKDLINDLLMDGEQVLELSKTNLKTINNIRDGYSTVLSIRLNQIMQVLTYVTAFLTIPMIIASVYGMNIDLPLANSPHAFSILISLNFVLMGITLLAFIIFKKKL